ncbi:hypothetical protein AAC387_Pa10g0503 [Persea americana]
MGWVSVLFTDRGRRVGPATDERNNGFRLCSSKEATHPRHCRMFSAPLPNSRDHCLCHPAPYANGWSLLPDITTRCDNLEKNMLQLNQRTLS